MVSNGGAIVEAAALTNGQLLIGSAAGAPVASTLTAGNSISISNSPGNIQISYEPSVTQITGTSTLTTTSSTYEALSTPMAYTVPTDGDYLVSFTASVTNSNNNTPVIMSIYTSSGQIPYSEREATSAQGGNKNTIASQAFITGMTTGQVIEIRWKTVSNQASVFNRTLIIQRVK